MRALGGAIALEPSLRGIGVPTFRDLHRPQNLRVLVCLFSLIRQPLFSALSGRLLGCVSFTSVGMYSSLTT